ncbi:pectin lyase fold/virulence factor [Armillaria luteobubalina]|uniref:galacturonan 1,4-alpha-galacturonidase n=1 Tax=Armillaria luteobubalina TaxID=153913 RepID=A0AA39Q9J5_9AGAR|nr:pectin lyase fold/virulence factor [Armillaria luteobubalina]
MFVFAGVVAGLIISSGRAAECTVERSDNGTDDSTFILKAFAECAEDSVITFAEANYRAYTPMSFTGLRNVTINLNGNLNLPNNISQVQQAISTTDNPPSTYATPWFYFSGSDVQLIGSESDEWGRFNGFGQQWWDIGNRTLRPQLATFNVTNGLLRGLKVIKPVAWGWNLPGQNIRVENHFVDARPDNGTRDDATSFPFNTDGINVSGQNITIDGYYGHNGDDCVSVVNGARDVLAQNGYCGFSSHGLSIGSLGKNGAVQTVQNVVFRNWTMEGAVYGARFKSWTGGRGFATNVTWEDIVLEGVSTAILITQNYYDQDKGARPENTNQTSTQISKFTYKNFTGTLAKNWSGDATQAIIFDLFSGTALNLSFSGINVTPNDTSKQATVICDPSTLAEGEQESLGFNCTDGLLVTTTIEPTEDSTMRMGVSMAGILLVGITLLLGV